MALNKQNYSVDNKYLIALLFLGLQCISIAMVVWSNDNQNLIFNNSVKIFTNKIGVQTAGLSNYLNLSNIIDSLVDENAQLIEQLENNRKLINKSGSIDLDQYYTVVAARVIRKTKDKLNNYVMLDKGSNDGVNITSGVLSNQGVVGQVVQVSENFSRVMTLEHSNAKISVKSKNAKYFGIMSWDTWSTNRYIIKDYPKYLDIKVGDTILTSGYSTIFPDSIPLGKVVDFSEQIEEDRLLVEVELFKDVLEPDYVYILKNNDRKEIDSLFQDGH